MHKARPVFKVALFFKALQRQEQSESFPAQLTNASSDCRQAPLTLLSKVSGAPVGVRTRDPQIKSQVLLPTELLAHIKEKWAGIVPRPLGT